MTMCDYDSYTPSKNTSTLSKEETEMALVRPSDYSPHLVKQPAQGSEDRQQSPVEYLRSRFNGALEKSTEASSRFAEQMTVMELGVTKSVILDAVSTMGRFNNPETFVTRLIGRVPGLGGLAERMKKSVQDTVVEGRSVRDVASSLIETLSKKRDITIESSGQISELVKDMVSSYDDLNAISQVAKESVDSAQGGQKIGFSSLMVEVVETMDYVKENIHSALGAIKASELAVEQVSGMIPKLRAILQDSMVIRKALNDLEELGQLTDLIDETCRVIRDDNHNKMESALLGVLDRSVISKEQLKHIENSANRTANFQKKIAGRLEEVTKQQINAYERLQPVVGSLGQDTREEVLRLGMTGTVMASQIEENLVSAMDEVEARLAEAYDKLERM